MTCVDFDAPGRGVEEFRLREKSEARRNAVPAALMGASQSFSLGIPLLDARFTAVATNVSQAKRILTDAALVDAISALPAGADVRVKDGKCFVAVKGHPDSVEFIDRLFAASERLVASLEANAGH